MTGDSVGSVPHTVGSPHHVVPQLDAEPLGIIDAMNDDAMVTVHQIQHDEQGARRAATIGSIDARLSVWGQAARDAASRRAEALVEGVLIYVEKVGRSAETLECGELDPASALLELEYASLVQLAGNLLPAAIGQSCRLLWVDTDRLRERLTEALAPHVEAARGEVRRRQALYRRRARLWQSDPARLDRLRDEVEAMRVPRCGASSAERVARGLFEKHRADPRLIETGADIASSRLKVRPGTIARWIAQLDERITA